MSHPTFKTVDTCAAEFAAETPYHYSTWEDESEVRPSDRPRVVILGSGPNRIGQGIEFDYCCVHASFALRDAGFETVMVNCNPETVSTDYDTSDRLYFEPLTAEDVLNVIAAETAAAGGTPPQVIVTLGGQTPLKLASLLPEALVAGTPPASIDLAEDREKWNAVCDELRIPQPPGGMATDLEEALAVVEQVGFPVLVRPSYVLGGRAMQIVHDVNQLASAMAELAGFGSLAREGGLSAERPVLIDRFLEDAVEVDVDAVRDVTGEVLDRRRHGARGGGRRALRRLGVRDPAPDVAVLGRRGDRGVHHGDRRAPRGAWVHQRAVRGDGHDGLRDRGQPASQQDGAVRRQGNGRATGEGGDAGDARSDAGRAARRGAAADLRAARRRRNTERGGEGSRPAVLPLPGGRPRARSRDALDR